MMRAWLPRFACPECGAPTDDGTCGAVACSGCGRRFECRDGIHRFLTPARQAAADPFLRQYRTVREQDGYRVSCPEYYRALPSVGPGDRQSSEWQIRQESYRQPCDA